MKGVSNPSQSVAFRQMTTDKGEVGGSSPPRPTIYFSKLSYRGRTDQNYLSPAGDKK